MKIEGMQVNYIKLITIMSITLTVYWQDLMIIFTESLYNNFNNYIIIIPMIFIYLVYKLRKVLLATISYNNNSKLFGLIYTKDIFGILICALAYFMRIYGSNTFLSMEYHIFSLPIFIYGLILLIYNYQTTKTLLFPILFLFFLTPIPENIIQNVGALLSNWSSLIAYQTIKISGIPIQLLIEYSSPILYLTSASGQEMSFSIDIACSGIYSLMGFTIFSIFISYISRVSIKNKIYITLIGFPLIYTLNIIRIIIILYIGYIFGPTIAVDIFHMFGGWILIFIGTLTLFAITDKILKIDIFKKTDYPCEIEYHSINNYCSKCGKLLNISKNNLPKYEIIKILSLILLSLSLISIRTPIFVFSEKGVQITMNNFGAESASILPTIEGYELNFQYRDSKFEEIAGQEASLMYIYRPLKSDKEPIWVGIEIGSTKACLHSWEGCLLTWSTFHGTEVQVTELDLKDIQIINNPPLTARLFAFIWNENGEGQTVLYWYTSSIFNTEEGYQEKIVKISVIEYPIDPSYALFAEKEMLPVAKQIVEYWQPAQEWSKITLTLSEQSTSIIYSLLITIIISFIINIIIKRAEISSNKIKIKKINDHIDKKLLNIIMNNEKQIMTISEIKQKIEEEFNINLEEEKIYEKLKKAKDMSLINTKIININDEPYITWISKLSYLN